MPAICQAYAAGHEAEQAYISEKSSVYRKEVCYERQQRLKDSKLDVDALYNTLVHSCHDRWNCGLWNSFQRNQALQG